MVIVTRVDHRLRHGQVAFSWVQNIGADCILIADDSSATDELKKSALKMAKPQGVKMVIKTIADSIEALKSGVTDKYKLFVVVGSVAAAKALADGYEGIRQINLGGTIAKDGTINVSKAVYLYPEEIEALRELHNRGVEVECRILPGDRKVPFESFGK